MSRSGNSLFPDVCLGCTLLCDEMTLKDGQYVPHNGNACAKGEQWYRQSSSFEGSDFDLKELTEQLQQAHHPVLVAGANVPLEGQLAVLEWIRQKRGVFVTADDAPASSKFGLHCTFGELKARCDFLVFWSCDLRQSHPRFFERFVHSGPQKPKVFYSGPITTTDDFESDTDSVIRPQVPLTSLDQELSVLNALHQLLQGRSIEHLQPVVQQTSLQIAQQLYEQFKQANYPVVVCSEQVHPAIGSVWQQMSLVRNDRVRIHLLPMQMTFDDKWNTAQQMLFQQSGNCSFTDNGIQFDSARITWNLVFSEASQQTFVIAGNTSKILLKQIECLTVQPRWIQIPADLCAVAMKELMPEQKYLSVQQTFFRADHVPIDLGY